MADQSHRVVATGLPRLNFIDRESGKTRTKPRTNLRREAPVISPVQPGGIWRIFLGLMAYLDLKGEGDKSMPGNQRPCRCVRAVR